jgi:hypothetical protein
VANLVDNNALLVIGDLVDDELGLAVAQTELVECSDALILNLNTIYRLSESRSGGGKEGGSGGFAVPRCELSTNKVSRLRRYNKDLDIYVQT